MGTRANIGITNDDGTYDWIYCHFDGYPEHTGAILCEVYNTEKKIRELLSLGDLSFLGRRLAPERCEKCSCDTRLPDVTVAFERDRGETGTEARRNRTEFAGCENGRVDYAYLFEDGKWHKTTHTNPNWTQLP